MVEIGNRVKLLKTNEPHTDLEKNNYIGTVYDINHVRFGVSLTTDQILLSCLNVTIYTR